MSLKIAPVIAKAKWNFLAAAEKTAVPRQTAALAIVFWPDDAG